MRRAQAARKLAAAAAYGGGGLGVLSGSLYTLLRAEAQLPGRTIGEANERVPDSTGWYGRGRPAPAIKIALLGDSSAAGYGVTSIEQTPGARLGSGAGGPAGARARARPRGRPVQRPGGPGHRSTADGARRRGHPDRCQRRHALGAPR